MGIKCLFIIFKLIDTNSPLLNNYQSSSEYSLLLYTNGQCAATVFSCDPTCYTKVSDSVFNYFIVTVCVCAYLLNSVKKNLLLNYMNLYLLWIWLFIGTDKIKVPYTTLKVIDYNVLSQTHLTDHMKRYQGNEPKALLWDARTELLWKEIERERADVRYLQ